MIDLKIAHQKQVADKVLGKLELLDPRCIVAGGAARDWYLNKPAKDIDVFLYAPHLHLASIRVNALRKLGFDITSAYENWNIDEIYKHNKYVKCLYNTVVDGENVQIIFMIESTYTSVVDMFPISISKVWYKNQQIKLTDDFKNSVKHKIIWRTLYSYLEDDKYINKIKDKFSDYEYVTTAEAVQIISEGDKNKLINELKQQLYKLESENKELQSKHREALIKLRSKDSYNFKITKDY